MGELLAFQIRFSTSYAVFHPGSFVSGDLSIRLGKKTDIKAIRILFVGEANVHWTESRTVSSGDHQETVTSVFKDCEHLFQQTVMLFGEGSSNTGSSLPQGDHSFPFNFQLPSPLPSSFEDDIGHIRYHAKGTIVKPWNVNWDIIKAFTVLNTLDLNLVPNAMLPSVGGDSKTLCCCCCRSGPISVEFSASRSAYVPGEWIEIAATVKNESRSRVKRTSASLIQAVTYHAGSTSKTENKYIAQIHGPSCDKRSILTWSNMKLHIPPLPPSESRHCRIIEVVYLVEFQGHLRTCALDLREYVPITIGTIPLHAPAMYQNLPPVVPTSPVGMATNANIAYAPQVGSMPVSSISITANLDTTPAPPEANLGRPALSYVPATGVGFNIRSTEDRKHTMGDATFTPQYTYYRWN